MTVTLPRLLIYALPAIPLAVLSLPMTLIVPAAYVEERGMAIAVVGYALLAVRLFDAFSDPVIGHYSDRIGGRYRRKIWFLIGVPLVMLGSFGIFMPPAEAGVGHLLIYGAILSIGTTATSLAYQAWGAELVTDYAGRSRVSGIREAVTVVGTMIATATPALLADKGDRMGVLAVLAAIILITLPLTALLAVRFVAEPVDHSRNTLSFRAGLTAVSRNAPFMRLIAAFMANSLANALPASLFLFYVSSVLQADDQAPLFLIIYFGMAVVSVPVWLFLNRRFAKHRLWAAALVMAASFFVIPSFLGPGDLWLYGLTCIVTGFALGADLILPPSIQADVIDVDTAASGEQRSGFYFALWALVSKAALALSVGLAYPILGAAGLQPGTGQSDGAGLLALVLLYGAVPVALKLAAAVLIWRFPVDGLEQARLRGLIEARG